MISQNICVNYNSSTINKLADLGTIEKDVSGLLGSFTKENLRAEKS